MRILHILDHSLPHHSGYVFRTLAILREQRALGWETFHLTGPKQGGGSETEETIDGWQFFRSPMPSGLLTGLPVLGEIEMMGEIAHRIDQAIRRVKPHILHAHSPVLNAIPALRAGRKHHLPVVYEVRAFWEDAAVDHGTSREWGARYRATRGLETWALKRADAVTTICDGLRSDIIARGIPADRVTVIPNAVDIDEFPLGGTADPGLRESLGLRDSIVLGFIGSFYAYEGLDLLLRATPRLVQGGLNVRVLLVGGGPQDAALKALTGDLGIGDRVVFTGRVSHDQVQRYYDLVDVLVYARHPMRLTELVTPLKPLEAMAQGRILVASDVGGHRELIGDAETGLLFRAGDVDDLVAKVKGLMGDPELRARLRSNGRRFVESQRNWRASVARYQDVYERALQQIGVAHA